VLLLATAAACSSKATQSQASPAGAAPTQSALPAETAVPIESSPPGDIPDSTQFVSYSGAGYHLQVPEGWARKVKGNSVTFTDKLTTISVDVVSASNARTPDTVRRIDEPKLKRSLRAFEEIKVEPAKLPGGTSVLLRYRANSSPNDVTGRSVRLEVDLFEIYNSGKLALLSLSAPAGSDNVDVWRLVSNSFRFGG
jgi:hypothetical protein